MESFGLSKKHHLTFAGISQVRARPQRFSSLMEPSWIVAHSAALGNKCNVAKSTHTTPVVAVSMLDADAVMLLMFDGLLLDNDIGTST
jgi:hypothetical protein